MSAPYKSISTDQAPSAIGPYCQATVHNGTIYCSGNIPFDPKTMQTVEGGVEAQTQQGVCQARHEGDERLLSIADSTLVLFASLLQP